MDNSSALLNYMKDLSLKFPEVGGQADPGKFILALSTEKTDEVSRFFDILHSDRNKTSNSDGLSPACKELIKLLRDTEVKQMSQYVGELARQCIREAEKPNEELTVKANELHALLSQRYPSAMKTITSNLIWLLRDPNGAPSDLTECGVALFVCVAINVAVSANIVVASHAAAVVVATAFVIGGSHPGKP